MSVTFQSGTVFDDAFVQVLNILGAAVTDAVAINARPHVFVLDVNGYGIRLQGRDLTYTDIGGKTVLTGGTIENVLVRSSEGLIGSFTGLELAATDYNAAILAEFLGTNPTALEEQFFDNDFVFQGTSTKDYLLPGSMSKDGYSLEPSGDDIAYLRGGSDKFALGKGNDLAYGGGGDDELWGSHGRDVLFGNSGNDTLWGQEGKDVLRGGMGDDLLIGGANKDVLHGGGQNDTLRGGGNDDILLAGNGDDTLYGGRNDDTLTGGGGADEFYFKAGAGDAGSGDDVITDFEAGTDTIFIDYGWSPGKLYSPLISLEDTKAGVLVTMSDGGTILLEGVQAEDISLFDDIQFI
jgi:Ca2+-binding RTX toxin-like protein